MTWKPKNVYEFWNAGYIRKGNEHGADAFGQYEYQIELDVSRFKSISEFQELTDFCTENFGELIEIDANSYWQVYSDVIHIQDRRIETLIFLFHNIDHAMAFKLRWM